jgi:hypothetical protein
MPLSSYGILQAIRGSSDGTPPFATGSLGLYLEDNFGSLGSASSWMIELYNQPITALVNRNLESFRIGIYEGSSIASMLVEDDRPDLIKQPYTISLFKRVARQDGYGEEEEAHILDLKDAIIAWTKDSATVSVLTQDSNDDASLFTFSYITTNTIVRELNYIYLELSFNALRQI